MLIVSVKVSQIWLLAKITTGSPAVLVSGDSYTEGILMEIPLTDVLELQNTCIHKAVFLSTDLISKSMVADGGYTPADAVSVFHSIMTALKLHCF